MPRTVFAMTVPTCPTGVGGACGKLLQNSPPLSQSSRGTFSITRNNTVGKTCAAAVKDAGPATVNPPTVMVYAVPGVRMFSKLAMPALETFL